LFLCLNKQRVQCLPCLNATYKKAKELTFLSLSLLLVGYQFSNLEGLNEGKEMVIILIRATNTSIIALIIFVLQVKTAWAVKELRK